MYDFVSLIRACIKVFECEFNLGIIPAAHGGL